ncbi:MPC4 [Scenedesmus sp. PABB004]|nr:MPC4 [Scenedesmus sp. PABB004]
MQRPAEKISTPQQCAVTLTGLIWTRYSTQIRPVNYNLMTVNAFMAVTGLYQLSRKFKHEMAKKEA